MDSKCKVSHCEGYRKLLVSEKPHSYGMRFYRCQAKGCPHFEWFDQFESVFKCFECGAGSHLARDCPSNKSPCNVPGCKGVNQVLTSGRPHSMGRKFQNCSSCSYFKWLSAEVAGVSPPPNSRGKTKVDDDRLTASKPSSSGKKKITIKIEIDVDDLSNELGGVTLG